MLSILSPHQIGYVVRVRNQDWNRARIQAARVLAWLITQHAGLDMSINWYYMAHSLGRDYPTVSWKITLPPGGE
jgi:hypothetical protein